MLKYDKLWVTLKEKNISQYKLIKDYGIDKAQLHRLRKKHGSQDNDSQPPLFHTRLPD